METCIELHLIQQFAPSCLNRDDTNSPKDCIFGGVRRARISSQCLKRFARLWFRDAGMLPIAMRTKRLKSELAKRFIDRDSEALDLALATFITTYYSGMKGDETTVLQFISPDELEVAAQAVTDYWDALVKGDKKKDGGVEKAIKAAIQSADIALFGRMLAEQADRNINAATQVAHAISTHRVDMELDFYTAIDDLNPEGATGAGMMGYTGFNSACFYRYALLDRGQLLMNLRGDTTLANQVTEAFLLASVFAIPTARQHGMAAQNLPSLGLFVVHQKGTPCNLANAFAKPIFPTQDVDIIGASVSALAHHWEKLQKVYGKQGVTAVALFQVDQENYLGSLTGADCGSVDDAIARVMAALAPEGAPV